MLLLNVSLRPNQRLKAFIQLLKYDVTLVSKGVIIFATANNIEVSQFHNIFSYNGYCWEIFYSNLMFVIPSRGQPDVRLPRGEVENEKNGLREWEKSESIMGMGKTSLFLKRAGSRQETCLKENIYSLRKQCIPVACLFNAFSSLHCKFHQSEWKLGAEVRAGPAELPWIAL